MTFLACSIFRAELEHLLGAELEATWLPAGLHVSEERLGKALDEALGSAEGAGLLLRRLVTPSSTPSSPSAGGRRLDARDCIGAFISPEERAKLGGRAFVISPGWLREWRSIFVEGMGWDEIDGRVNFGMYDVIAVLDFGL